MKSDCPVQIFRKMVKYLKIQYRPLLCLICLDIKKNKSSENDLLTGHFQSFFIYF